MKSDREQESNIFHIIAFQIMLNLESTVHKVIF